MTKKEHPISLFRQLDLAEENWKKDMCEDNTLAIHVNCLRQRIAENSLGNDYSHYKAIMDEQRARIRASLQLSFRDSPDVTTAEEVISLIPNPNSDLVKALRGFERDLIEARRSSKFVI